MIQTSTQSSINLATLASRQILTCRRATYHCSTVAESFPLRPEEPSSHPPTLPMGWHACFKPTLIYPKLHIPFRSFEIDRLLSGGWEFLRNSQDLGRKMPDWPSAFTVMRHLSRIVSAVPPSGRAFGRNVPSDIHSRGRRRIARNTPSGSHRKLKFHSRRIQQRRACRTEQDRLRRQIQSDSFA